MFQRDCCRLARGRDVDRHAALAVWRKISVSEGGGTGSATRVPKDDERGRRLVSRANDVMLFSHKIVGALLALTGVVAIGGLVAIEALMNAIV